MNQPDVIGARKRTVTGVEVPEVPSPAEALASVKASASGPLNDAIGADGVGPEREFTLDHVDERGRRWTGAFKVKVLTVQDTIRLGLTKARMAGGVPMSHLDAETALNLEVLAHLAVALVSAPPWAKDLSSLYDVGVLGVIYEEVAKHEARFRRPEPVKTGGVDGKGAE